jgi:hypothetical protein
MRFDNTFVRELPGDKESANTLRQVTPLHGCGGGGGGGGEGGGGWEHAGSDAMQMVVGRGGGFVLSAVGRDCSRGGGRSGVLFVSSRLAAVQLTGRGLDNAHAIYWTFNQQ